MPIDEADGTVRARLLTVKTSRARRARFSFAPSCVHQFPGGRRTTIDNAKSSRTRRKRTRTDDCVSIGFAQLRSSVVRSQFGGLTHDADARQVAHEQRWNGPQRRQAAVVLFR